MVVTLEDGFETLRKAGEPLWATAQEPVYSLSGAGFDSFNVGGYDDSYVPFAPDSWGEPEPSYDWSYEDTPVPFAPESWDEPASWGERQPSYDNYDVPFAPESWGEPQPEQTDYSLNFPTSAFTGYGNPNATDPWSANNQEPDDGGFWGGVRDVAGDIGGGLQTFGSTFADVAFRPKSMEGFAVTDEPGGTDLYRDIYSPVTENAFSGEKFQDTLGIDTDYMDWLREQGLLGKTAAYGIDTLTAPATILTAGMGSEVPLIGSAFGGGFAKRLAGEAAVGTTAYLGSDAAVSDVADKIPYFSDQPDWLRRLEGGAIAGIGTVGGLKAVGKAGAALGPEDFAPEGAPQSIYKPSPFRVGDEGQYPLDVARAMPPGKPIPQLAGASDDVPLFPKDDLDDATREILGWRNSKGDDAGEWVPPIGMKAGPTPEEARATLTKTNALRDPARLTDEELDEAIRRTDKLAYRADSAADRFRSSEAADDYDEFELNSVSRARNKAVEGFENDWQRLVDEKTRREKFANPRTFRDIVNDETGQIDLSAYVNAGAVARRKVLNSLQDVATREGRPTGGIYDDILPTEQVKTGLMRGYEGKTGTAGLALQRDLDNGNRALRSADIGRMNGRNLQVNPKRVNGKVDPNDDVVQLFQALHGEGEPPPRLKSVFDDLKRMVAEETDDTLKQNKDFVLKDDYFYRGWKAPKETAPGVGKGQVGAKPGYQKPRIDATFSELIAEGWEPLSWNPYEMAALRRYAGVQFREQKALVDALKQTNLAVAVDGATPTGWRIPRVGPAFEGKPFAFTPNAAPLADAVGSKVGYTQQFAVPDKLANEIENIFGKTPDMGAILNTIAGAGQKAKQLKLVASLFQQVDFATRQGAAGFASAIDSLVAGQPLTAVKNLITVPSDMAKLPISNLSGVRQRQIRDMILDGKPLFKERPGVSLKSISDAGWSTSDITIVNRTIRQSLDDMLSDPKGLRKLASDVGGDATITGAPLRKLKKLNEASQRGLFEGVYPQAQATSLKKFIVPRLMRQHPDWTDAQISAASATEVNKMFSTLGNFQQVVKNPVSKKFLGSLIFSTNETESLIRQAASTVVGPNKQMWTEYYVGAFVFLAATANLVNYAATGEFLDPGQYSPVKKDPYSPLGVGYNNRFMAPQVPFLKGRNGMPVSLDLMGQLDTVFRILDPHGFIEGRENVLPRAALSQMQGEDFFGRPLKGPKERIGQLATDLFEPIGAQQIRGALDIGPDSEGRLGNIGQVIQSSGVNLRGETTRAMKDRLAQETYGKSWDEISPTQQENIKRENPNFKSELELRRDESAAQNNEYGIRQKKSADALSRLTAQQTASDAKLQSGEIDPEQWRKDYTERKNELYIRNDQIYADAGDFETKDPILAPYYAAIDGAKGADGKIDWDAVDAYRGGLSQAQQDYLDRNTGLVKIDTPQTQQFKKTYDAIAETGYFERSDQTWKQVADVLGLKEPDYYAWRDAKAEEYRQMFGSTKNDLLAASEIDKLINKDPVAKAFDNLSKEWRVQFYLEHPAEAYQAWLMGYHVPPDPIKAYLQAEVGNAIGR